MLNMSSAIGPNKIRESNVYWTTNRTESVKLRLGEDGITARQPVTVPDILEKTVQDFPNNIALSYKDSSNQWKSVTFKEYQEKVLHIAKVFIKLGLDARNSVGILAFNCPEWFYSGMGAIHAGGISVGVYTTNSPEAVYHILENACANIVVVDEPKQMEKIRKIKHKLPMLKAAIQIEGPFDETLKEEDGYYQWSTLEKMNVDDMKGELDTRLQEIVANECCSLIYTSGTTGMPKGVMLSHDNITWDAYVSTKVFYQAQPGMGSIVSYLPLSHVAAMNGDMFLSLILASTVYFADRGALKGTLGKTLTEVRPTIFGGVPRVFEKIQEKMTSIEAQTGTVRKSILNWAKSCALQHHMDVMEGKHYETFQYKLAKMLVLNKIRYAMGLDRTIAIFCGAAPVSLETKKFFMSIDCPIREIYGLSENFGGQCVSNLEDSNLETAGPPLEGTEVKIMNPDSEGHGEICLRGRHIFMGYLDNTEKTLEALDNDGWLHTGDIGYIDDKGLVYISGRLKELIITAGGENIPPTRIENLVKHELPVISNAFLVGDKRKYLTILASLKTEMNPETGAPLDKLHPETQKWIESLDLSYSTLKEILDAGPCPKVMKELEAAVIRANKSAISNAQKVQKIALLPHDFSIPTGELGPTLKVKRNEVVKIHNDLIERLYKE